MTHTPGPWRVHSEHADRIIVNGCCVYQVREMTTDDGQPSPTDVRLMAAAPELLAAAQAVRDDFRQFVFTDGYHRLSSFSAHAIVAVLDAAIAKAEGRTSAQD